MMAAPCGAKETMATTEDRHHRKTHAPAVTRDTSRVEAFSDGVFAIAITLLILQINVPRPQSPSEPLNLWAGLLGLWPSYFAYILSFVTIGIYWTRHHYLFILYQRADYALKWLNLFFLMCISFLPFPTDVLATYLTDPTHHHPLNRTAAVTFYAIGLLLPAVSWTVTWLYASRGYRLLDPRLDAGFVRAVTVKYSVSVAAYLGAVLVSLIDYRLGLGVCVGVTFLYLFPPRAPIYVRDAP